ncbi:MAG: hypothetical protein LBM16_04220 [Clostridiales bacterium]|nr:hypothetical protein [Clostridiales bacterium]
MRKFIKLMALLGLLFAIIALLLGVDTLSFIVTLFIPITGVLFLRIKYLNKGGKRIEKRIGILCALSNLYTVVMLALLIFSQYDLSVVDSKRALFQYIIPAAIAIIATPQKQSKAEVGGSFT